MFNPRIVVLCSVSVARPSSKLRLCVWIVAIKQSAEPRPRVPDCAPVRCLIEEGTGVAVLGIIEQIAGDLLQITDWRTACGYLRLTLCVGQRCFNDELSTTITTITRADDRVIRLETLLTLRGFVVAILV